MLRIRLREAMKRYRRRTGEKMTYERLGELTGLSPATLAVMASLGSRGGYNATIDTIDKVCRALGCQPGDLLELADEEDVSVPGQSGPDRAQ